MILIIGHGSSAKKIDHDFIDAQDTVVRLKWKKLAEHWHFFVGNKFDVLCAYNPTQGIIPAGVTVWAVDGKSRSLCRGTLKKYNPMKNKRKPSTGFCACVIARDKYPDANIGVIGFDYTLHPETAPITWLHDTRAECEALKDLGIKELSC